MKITRLKNGHTIRLTDNELDLLREMVAMAENAQGVLWNRLDSGSRRAYSRRCGKKLDKQLLRVDADRRGDEQ